MSIVKGEIHQLHLCLIVSNFTIFATFQTTPLPPIIFPEANQLLPGESLTPQRGGCLSVPLVSTPITVLEEVGWRPKLVQCCLVPHPRLCLAEHPVYARPRQEEGGTWQKIAPNVGLEKTASCRDWSLFFVLLLTLVIRVSGYRDLFSLRS